MSRFANETDTLAIDSSNPDFAAVVQQYEVTTTPYVVVFSEGSAIIKEIPNDNTIKKVQAFNRIQNVNNAPLQPQANVSQIELAPQKNKTSPAAPANNQTSKDINYNQVKPGNFDRNKVTPDSFSHETPETSENSHVFDSGNGTQPLPIAPAQPAQPAQPVPVPQPTPAKPVQPTPVPQPTPAQPVQPAQPAQPSQPQSDFHATQPARYRHPDMVPFNKQQLATIDDYKYRGYIPVNHSMFQSNNQFTGTVNVTEQVSQILDVPRAYIDEVEENEWNEQPPHNDFIINNIVRTPLIPSLSPTFVPGKGLLRDSPALNHIFYEAPVVE